MTPATPAPRVAREEAPKRHPRSPLLDWFVDRSRSRYSVSVADPEQIFSSGVVIDRQHVAAVDILVLEFVGEVDALEGQLEVRIDRVLDRRVDVERDVRSLHVIPGLRRRILRLIATAVGSRDPGTQALVLLIKRRIGRLTRQLRKIINGNYGT